MVKREGRSVRLIPTGVETGPMNMALDAVAAETVSEGGPATVRVYEWEPSTLSLGYAQDPKAIDWSFCERSAIDVTRRPTGGGAIYHDAFGDISYSIVMSSADLPDRLTACYRRLCEPVLAAFERLGIPVGFATDDRPPAFEPACYLRGLHPAHDLVVEGEDGRERKISGTAQYRRRDAVVQHGSLTYDARPRRHLACFSDPSVDLETFRSRVTSIRTQAAITRSTVIEYLTDALAAHFDARIGGWDPRERRRARELVAERYGNPAWVEERVDSTAVE